MSIYAYLSDLLLIDEKEIIKYIYRAPRRYRVYEIPKRNGSGSRIIAQPSKELKILQKLALEMPLFSLPIHKSAFAYMKEIGIKQNAEAHSTNQYLLKMDFSNFFPSITANDFIVHIKKHHENVSEIDLDTIRKLFFWCPKGSSEYRLSIGAPSSPFISNTILFEFDSIVNDICTERDIVYTRYADDLTFTTNISDTLFDLPEIIRDILKDLRYPKLEINLSKTVFSSKKNNRHVTGLVLTNENTVSLGRKRKRYIRSLVFKFSNRDLSEEEVVKLKGLIGFSKHIEPVFYSSLIKKYSFHLISEIEKFNS